MKILVLLLSCVSVLLGQQSNERQLLFDFKSDVRLFTTYAFMNASGVDFDWRAAGMHPIRVAVRKDLEGRLDSAFLKKIKAFRLAHNSGSWTQFGPYALITNGPPDFRISYDSATSEVVGVAKSSEGLSDLLSEFYRKARIEQMWDKYRPVIQAENDRFKPFAARALDDIESYCRFPRGFFARSTGTLHHQFCPLMSYYTSQTVKVNGEIYIIAGPQEGEPDESAFYHEALHHVITPLTATLDNGTRARFASLFSMVRSGSSIAYQDFDEAFVRTLDRVISGKRFGRPDSLLLASVTNEYKLGFVLCRAIYEQLGRYEKSQLTFAQYFPKIISSIDIEHEKQQWREFNHMK